MRSTSLALAVLLAAGTIHARADELTPSPGSAPPRAEGQGTSSVKPKDRILRLLEVTRALARWTPNEASFLGVLDGVQERIIGAKGSELAPMEEFTPYLSHLTAALSRMEARVGSLQSAAELCDPSRRRELFLLFLD